MTTMDKIENIFEFVEGLDLLGRFFPTQKVVFLFTAFKNHWNICILTDLLVSKLSLWVIIIAIAITSKFSDNLNPKTGFVQKPKMIFMKVFILMLILLSLSKYLKFVYFLKIPKMGLIPEENMLVFALILFVSKKVITL
jgi:hypothetical protein